MGIFQRGSATVSVKKSTIFSSVFLSKIGLEIMLSYGLERKETFEDDKNLSCLKSKKWASLKGLTHGSVKSHQVFLFPLGGCYVFSENSQTLFPFNVILMF